LLEIRKVPSIAPCFQSDATLKNWLNHENRHVIPGPE
jgi:hypothetical protein